MKLGGDFYYDTSGQKVIFNFQTLWGFAGECYLIPKEELTPIFHSLFQKPEEEEILSNSFYEVNVIMISTHTKTVHNYPEQL